MPKSWVLQHTSTDLPQDFRPGRLGELGPLWSPAQRLLSSRCFSFEPLGVSMGMPDWKRSQIRARSTSAQDLLFFAPTCPGLLAACWMFRLAGKEEHTHTQREARASKHRAAIEGKNWTCTKKAPLNPRNAEGYEVWLTPSREFQA